MKQTSLVRIKSSVERVIYHSTENGFCVLRVSVKSKREPITVVGNATQVMAGEDIELKGLSQKAQATAAAAAETLIR